MSNGTDFLNYELYTTGWPHHRLGYDQPCQLRRGEQGVDELTIFGRVPSDQDVSAGSYTDTVVAPAEF